MRWPGSRRNIFRVNNDKTGAVRIRSNDRFLGERVPHRKCEGLSPEDAEEAIVFSSPAVVREQ
jgi:hypothetical protein